MFASRRVPFPGLDVTVELAVHQGDPLAHSEQSEPTAAVDRRIEAAAVVLYLDEKLPVILRRDRRSESPRAWRQRA